MTRTHRISIAAVSGLIGVLSIAIVSCGGAKKAAPNEPGGSSGPGEPGAAAQPGDNGAPAKPVEGGGVEHPVAIDAGQPPDAALPPSPVTFVLKNTGSEELALNLDRGWGAVVLAWSGKPPHAKPIIMFAPFCTASCDAAAADLCPVCEEPAKVTDVRAAQKLEKVAVGAELEVRWDAKVFATERVKGAKHESKPKPKPKTPGKLATTAPPPPPCQCWRPADPAPATYTVRACGLHLSTTVDKSSQLVCAEGKMTLPVTEPTRVELAFPDAKPAGKPAKPGATKKKH